MITTITISLSEEQINIIKRLAAGDTNKEIANSLKISPGKVAGIIRNLRLALNAKNRYHLITVSYKTKLLP